MNVERAVGILAAALLLSTASCSHGEPSTTAPSAAPNGITLFSLNAQKHDDDEDRWPGDITKGPDGALWFTELNGGSIGRITTAGKVTEWRIHARAIDARPGSIALGKDGALWFTINNFHEIGRITTAGKITEYSAGEDIHPAGIAAAPDGALWFTAPTGQLIGRITTSGKLSHYPVHTAQAFPQNITVGPDGALWFTERIGRIGRITSSGAVTEFPVHPPKGRALFGITTGPDHALWFTEPNAKMIGRMTTTGQITEYAVPSGYPTSITASPDGALWFTAITPSSVNRIDTTGTIVQYPLATSFDKPGAIVPGPVVHDLQLRQDRTARAAASDEDRRLGGITVTATSCPRRTSHTPARC